MNSVWATAADEAQGFLQIALEGLELFGFGAGALQGAGGEDAPPWETCMGGCPY